MKKSVWISMIVAGACILAGLACIAVGHAMGGNYYMKNSAVESTFTFTENIQHIRIETVSADITLSPSEDGVCRVVAMDDEWMHYTAEITDGTLAVVAKDQRSGYRRVFHFFSYDEPSVTVYLPHEAYQSLTTKAVSGDVEVDGRLIFSGAVTLTATSGDIEWQGSAESLSAKTTSGDISLENATVSGEIIAQVTTGEVLLSHVACGSMKLHGGTGDIEMMDSKVAGQITAEITTGDVLLSRVTCDSLDAQTTTGRIELTDTEVKGQITVKAGTGDISMNRSPCDSLDAQTTTGRIELANTVVTGQIKVKTTSGAIRFQRADAATLSLKTTSGSVTGSLRTPKVFYTDTTSGSVDVPRSTEGGLCEVKTTSGDIHLTVED